MAKVRANCSLCSTKDSTLKAQGTLPFPNPLQLINCSTLVGSAMIESLFPPSSSFDSVVKFFKFPMCYCREVVRNKINPTRAIALPNQDSSKTNLQSKFPIKTNLKGKDLTFVRLNSKITECELPMVEKRRIRTNFWERSFGTPALLSVLKATLVFKLTLQ